MRDFYDDQLDALDADLVAMTTAVRFSLTRASTALLDGDLGAAETVISGDAVIDAARESCESDAISLLATQQPVATDLRRVVAGLRIAGDLERIGDLAVHVAKLARMRMPEAAVPPSARPIIAKMARVAEGMLESVAIVLGTHDLDAAAALLAADDEMDGLYRRMFRNLLDAEWDGGVEAAVDVALLSRYYERTGDHAVSIARRVVYQVTGEVPQA
ncbi:MULTISPECIES: phosphate signaling complex protein PhoU [Mumia]|uniref:phosphate signaling complex protein PhoU n=1 Tax=Mumia TaxID=1546255 RepID=UPI001420B507|nr:MULTISPECIES: phosphate signaling complex protein PhoU [unclassified Mumia]QMW66902.1 phosphate signaling complex protein PhoU [Mumia sp. ZJ1417]